MLVKILLKKTVKESHFLHLLQSRMHIRIERNQSDPVSSETLALIINEMPSVNVSILSILEWFQEIKPII